MTSRTTDQPVRILHMVPDLGGGGLQNGVVNLVNGLPPAQFEHEICCLHGTGQFQSRLAFPVQVHQLHAGRHDLRTPIRLARILRRFRPDVVHARNWSTWPDSVMGQMLARCGRVVFSFHGWDSDEPVRPLRARACRWLARGSHHLASVSRHAARQFAGEVGLDPSRFEIIPNGVDLRRFQTTSSRSAIRHELGISPRSFVMGSVGRLEAVKDFATLQRAAAELLRSGCVDCELLLVGDGSLRAALERQAAELGLGKRVHITGWRADAPRLLPAMDIFVMTSLREGMNNAILEAMASGVPVIATAVGGTPELIADGANGRLIQPGIPQSLSRAVIDLVGAPTAAAAMAERARLRVDREFSLPRMLDRYANMYRRIAQVPSGLRSVIQVPRVAVQVRQPSMRLA